MRKFIINSIIFILILIPIVNIKPLYLLFTDKYKLTVAGPEIYQSIFKSKQKNPAKKLLLGDSVTNQLFCNTAKKDTITSLACNQAIGIVGHFLLLNNYLKAGNKVDTVFMMFIPSSFSNNLNQIYTYHYFLKPFFNDEYKSLFTKSVTDQIQKIPYSNICRFAPILTSNWAPDFKTKDKPDYTFLSPISVDYLNKIKALSINYHFKLIILSGPICLSKKNKIEKIDRQEITKNNLDSEFQNYFKNIIYLNDSLFLDGTHLKKNQISYYSKYYRNILIH